jgi:branched-chain amino acid transport system ATP-binding protein
MLLEVKNMNTFYGPSHVLQDLSLTVERGEIVALLGRNGMGKSTTLMSIMGLVRPRSGQVIYSGRDLAGKPPYRIAKAGIGYIPEDRRIFANLTVLENLHMGAKNQGKNGGGSTENRWNLERIFATFPWMKERSAQHGQFLSGGEQQMLAIGRALMGNPELLLVDEPTEGLAPLIVRQVRDVLKEINQAGVSILLVEHNYQVAISLADRVYLMEKARIGYEGSPGALEASPETKQAFLEV